MKLFDFIPWYIKYPALGVWLIAVTPSWVGKKFDERWEAKAAPYRRERDIQLKTMNEKLDRIEKSAFRIESILMKDK